MILSQGQLRVGHTVGDDDPGEGGLTGNGVLGHYLGLALAEGQDHGVLRVVLISGDRGDGGIQGLPGEAVGHGGSRAVDHQQAVGIIQGQVVPGIPGQVQRELALAGRELERLSAGNHGRIGVDPGAVAQLAHIVLTPGVHHAVIGVSQDVARVGGGRHAHHVLQIALTGAASVDQSGRGLLLLLAPVAQDGGVGILTDAPHIHVALVVDCRSVGVARTGGRILVVAGVEGDHLHADGGIGIGLALNPGGDLSGLGHQLLHQRPQGVDSLLGIIGAVLHGSLNELDLIIELLGIPAGISQGVLGDLILQSSGGAASDIARAILDGRTIELLIQPVSGSPGGLPGILGPVPLNGQGLLLLVDLLPSQENALILGLTEDGIVAVLSRPHVGLGGRQVALSRRHGQLGISQFAHRSQIVLVSVLLGLGGQLGVRIGDSIGIKAHVAADGLPALKHLFLHVPVLPDLGQLTPVFGHPVGGRLVGVDKAVHAAAHQLIISILGSHILCGLLICLQSSLRAVHGHSDHRAVRHRIGVADPSTQSSLSPLQGILSRVQLGRQVSDGRSQLVGKGLSALPGCVRIGVLGQLQQPVELAVREVAVLGGPVQDRIIGQAQLLRQGCHQVVPVTQTHHIKMLGQLLTALELVEGGIHLGQSLVVELHGQEHGLGRTQRGHGHALEIIQLVGLLLLEGVQDGLLIGGDAVAGQLSGGGQTLSGLAGGVDHAVGGEDVHVVTAEVDLHRVVNTRHLGGPDDSVVAGGDGVSGTQLLAQVVAPDKHTAVLTDGGGAVAIGVHLDDLAGVGVAQVVAIGHAIDQTRDGLVVLIGTFVIQT